MTIPPPAAIAKAFFNVVNKRNSKRCHGKWVPVTYWTSLVNLELKTVEIKAARLRSSLKDYLDRDLETEADADMTGFVVKVTTDCQKVRHSRYSEVKANDGKKKKHFFKVDTEATKGLEYHLPTNKLLITKHFQEAYDKYDKKMNRRSSGGVLLWVRTTAAAVESSIVKTTNDNPSQSTLTVAAINSPIPRTVTPTGPPNALYSIRNVDLKEIFNGIINPEFLKRDDLFVGDGETACRIFRDRIQQHGCNLQAKKTKDHYNRFYPSQPTQLSALDKKKHLLLTERYKIPMVLPALHDLQQAIAVVADVVPAVLDLPKHGGSKGLGKRMISITPATSEKSLYANAKKWMPRIIEAAIADDCELARYHVVSTLLKVLLTIERQSFIDVSRSKVNMMQQKFEALTQKALTYEGSFSNSQIKILRKYIISLLGHNIFQPLDEIKKLDVDAFQPTPVKFKDKHRNRVCHYTPVDKVMKWKLDKFLEREESVLRFSKHSDPKNLATCHIVVGGDHGQKAFRMVATVLIFSNGGIHKHNLELEEDFIVGFIGCKKDTHGIISSTIAAPLNESLRALGEELVFLEDDDGNRFVEWGAANAAEAVRTRKAKILHSIPVELFMVGDLAYQLMCQGRDGFSTYWCAYCQWGRNDWQSSSATWDGVTKIGVAWTTGDMKAMLLQIESKEEQKKSVTSRERKGITAPILFDAIPVENFIVPPLHAVDLFMNSIKKNFDLFVDHRLEDRPEEMIQARREEAQAKIEERKAIEFKAEVDALIALAEEIEDVDLLDRARADGKLADDLHKAAKKAFGKAAAACRKLEQHKDYGAMTQARRQQIDSLLADIFNIRRSSYHGGDMEGNYARRLMKLAEEAMEAIQQLLLDIPRDERAPGCTDDEIRTYCGAFRGIFQYMDVLSHFCYQPYGSITDSEMVNVRLLINKMDNLWRKLSANTPPKVHAWQHLADHLDSF